MFFVKHILGDQILCPAQPLWVAFSEWFKQVEVYSQNTLGVGKRHFNMQSLKILGFLALHGKEDVT